MKRVILITGTPCVGKTTTAKALAEKLNAEYINLTDYAKQNNLTLGEDTERGTTIIDEEAMQINLGKTIDTSQKDYIIIDGHYAAAVISEQYSPQIFVLRRNPKELKQFMIQRGYSDSKMWENLQAEIIDICLSEAIESHTGTVCELDITGTTTQQVIKDIIEILEKNKSCQIGKIDWISRLESEGILDQYLKPQ